MSNALESRLTALESEVQELKSREAIREVIHRYCQAVDRFDLDMLKSCYWDEGYALTEKTIPASERGDHDVR